MTDRSKLYIVVSSALAPGVMLAQACHAAVGFIVGYPDIAREWHGVSNNLVVLVADDIPSWAAQLHAAALAVTVFHEPDLEDAMTALAVEPAAGRMLRRLPLAG